MPSDDLLPYDPPALSPVLGGWIQFLFWAASASSLVVSVLSLSALGHFNTYWSSRPGSRDESRAFDSWVASDGNTAAAAGWLILFSLPLFVLMIIWAFKAHRATAGLRPGLRRWSIGWTIGAWFIPIGNLWVPKLVIGEIEKIALTRRVSGQVDSSWRTARTSTTGWAWWALAILGGLLVGVGGALFPELDEVGESFSSGVRGYHIVQALGAATLAAGCAFGAVYIRRVGRALSPGGMVIPPEASTRVLGTADNVAAPPPAPQIAPPERRVASTPQATSTPKPSPPPPSPTQQRPSLTADAAVAEALRQIRALHDEGILTDEEYETKRKRLAEQL